MSSHIKEYVPTGKLVTYEELLFSPKNSQSYISMELMNKLKYQTLEQKLTTHELIRFNQSKRYDLDLIMENHAVYQREQLIEASMISDCLIASSAPIKREISNFWRMISENDVNVIVSLTPWKENNIKKADPYFENNNRVYFDDVVVSTELNLTSDISSNLGLDLRKCGIDINRIKLHFNDKPNNFNRVIHIHFTKWTDSSIPTIDNMYVLLRVYSYFMRFQHQVNKSLVHCSAGIGRTGTFIILCLLLTKINNDILTTDEGNFIKDTKAGINFIKAVACARNRRAKLVQTQEQMDFIIEFVKYYLHKIIVQNHRMFDMKVYLHNKSEI